MSNRRLIAILTKNPITYKLKDLFGVNTAAGSVNGTIAEPSGGARTIVDAENKISLANSKLVVAGGKASPAAGDPGLWYTDAITRKAGLIAIFKNLYSASYTQVAYFGFDEGKTGLHSGNSIRFLSSNVITGFCNGATSGTVGTSVDAATYQLAVILRATGAYYFIKGGTYTNWTLLLAGVLNSTTTLYLGTSNHNLNYTLNDIVVPNTLWLPSPEISDGFGGVATTSDGLGHAETSGIGSGGAGKTWAGATWSNSGGFAINTPVTLGDECLVDGALENWTSSTNLTSWTEAIAGTSTVEQETTEIHGGSNAAKMTVDASSSLVSIYQAAATIGKWYKFSVWLKIASGTPAVTIGSDLSNPMMVLPTSSYSQFSTITRANSTAQIVKRGSASAAFYVDDISVKEVQFAELIKSTTSSTSNIISQVAVTLNIASIAGLIINLDSAGTPQNFVLVTLFRRSNGMYVKVEKCVAGTYSLLVETVATYSAGAVLMVQKISTSYRILYNNALIGTPSTISDAGIISNTLHGLFSTDASVQLDNFVCRPTGTEGQYNKILNKF